MSLSLTRSPPFPPPPSASRPAQQTTFHPKVDHRPLHPKQSCRKGAQNPLGALRSSAEAKFSLPEAPGPSQTCACSPGETAPARRAGEVRGDLGIGPEAQLAATAMSCRTLARAPPLPTPAAAQQHGHPPAPAQPPLSPGHGLCSRLQLPLGRCMQSSQVRMAGHCRSRSEPGALPPPDGTECPDTLTCCSNGLLAGMKPTECMLLDSR